MFTGRMDFGQFHPNANEIIKIKQVNNQTDEEVHRDLASGPIAPNKPNDPAFRAENPVPIDLNSRINQNQRELQAVSAQNDLESLRGNEKQQEILSSFNASEKSIFDQIEAQTLAAREKVASLGQLASSFVERIRESQLARAKQIQARHNEELFKTNENRTGVFSRIRETILDNPGTKFKGLLRGFGMYL